MTGNQKLAILGAGILLAMCCARTRADAERIAALTTKLVNGPSDKPAELAAEREAIATLRRAKAAAVDAEIIDDELRDRIEERNRRKT